MAEEDIRRKICEVVSPYLTGEAKEYESELVDEIVTVFAAYVEFQNERGN